MREAILVSKKEAREEEILPDDVRLLCTSADYILIVYDNVKILYVIGSVILEDPDPKNPNPKLELTGVKRITPLKTIKRPQINSDEAIEIILRHEIVDRNFKRKQNEQVVVSSDIIDMVPFLYHHRKDLPKLKLTAKRQPYYMSVFDLLEQAMDDTKGKFHEEQMEALAAINKPSGGFEGNKLHIKVGYHHYYFSGTAKWRKAKVEVQREIVYTYNDVVMDGDKFYTFGTGIDAKTELRSSANLVEAFASAPYGALVECKDDHPFVYVTFGDNDVEDAPRPYKRARTKAAFADLSGASAL